MSIQSVRAGLVISTHQGAKVACCGVPLLRTKSAIPREIARLLASSVAVVWFSFAAARASSTKKPSLRSVATAMEPSGAPTLLKVSSIHLPARPEETELYSACGSERDAR
jgi:hypothetical protein